MIIIYYEDNNPKEALNNHQLRNETNQKIKQYFEKFGDVYSLISNNLIYIILPVYKNNHLRDICLNLLQEFKDNDR